MRKLGRCASVGETPRRGRHTVARPSGSDQDRGGACHTPERCASPAQLQYKVHKLRNWAYLSMAHTMEDRRHRVRKYTQAICDSVGSERRKSRTAVKLDRKKIYWASLSSL
jgi:hypothetical protein